MKDLWKNGSLLQILLVGILIALLGITPLSKAVTAGFEGIHRPQEISHPGIVPVNLATVAEQHPWRSGFWEAAGNAALAAEDPKNAGDYFKRAAARGELSPEGYLAWGDADWGAEKPQTALQIWEIAERHGVSQTEVLVRQSEIYRVLGDDLALIETLREMLQQPAIVNRQSADLHDLTLELGLLLAAYEPASAPAYLSSAVEYDPALEPQIRSLNFDIQRALSHDDPVYLLMISGRSLANLGYWDLAEKAFENATSSQPEYAEAWAYLGEARQHTESGVEPLVALETALELDPDSIAAITFFALYWQRNSENELALEYLQTAANLDPGNPAYLAEIGNLVALQGDLDAGQNYYIQAIALSSNDPKYVREFLTFSVQFNLNLRDVALPMARKLVMFEPKDPASLDLMGDILSRLDDLLNAERFFLRSLAQDPENDQAHLQLADLYRSQAKHNLAHYHYVRVLDASTNAQTKARAQEALELYNSP
jgi:Tfp pilus assembly protein PilF